MRYSILVFFTLLVATRASDVEIIYDPTPAMGLPNQGDTSKKDWHEDHGTIGKILGDSILRIRIRYFSNGWKNADEVKAYLKELLENTQTKTYEAPVWAQGFGADIECVIFFKDGKHGVWAVSGWTSCFQDSTGKYWFATQQDAWNKQAASKRKLSHNHPLERSG